MATYKEALLRNLSLKKDLNPDMKASVIQEFPQDPSREEAYLAVVLQKPIVDCKEEMKYNEDDDEVKEWETEEEDGEGKGQNKEEDEEEDVEEEEDEEEDEVPRRRRRKGGRYRCARRHVDGPRAAYHGRRA